MRLSCAFALGVLAVLWAARGAAQPLWLDELHSGWTIAGSWSDIASRAGLGNQSACFFWLLKSLTTLLTLDIDQAIRIPSLLAWPAAITAIFLWLTRYSTRRWQLATSFLWCSCILLDPLQYFYAMEGRCYGLLQLINLLGWFAVSVCVSAGFKNVEKSPIVIKPLVVWTASSLLCLNLQVTSLLAVSIQAAVLAFGSIRQNRYRAAIAGAVAVVLSNAIWILLNSQGLWQRREQWSSFAGDASLHALLTLFPVAALAIPVVAAVGLAYFTQNSDGKHGNDAGTHFKAMVAIWLLAAIGPALTGWLLTRYHVAPVFHYRFVITSALPLYVFGGTILQYISRPTWRVAAVGAAFSWMMLAHGPLSQHAPRYWGFQRHEGWHGAASFVSEQLNPETDKLWCYAGLIEGYGLTQPIDSETNAYLSYPLRGPYSVRVAAQQFMPGALTGDRETWHGQLRSSEMTDTSIRHWIVYRGSAKRLETDLKAAHLTDVSQTIMPTREFGTVSVTCLQLD